MQSAWKEDTQSTSGVTIDDKIALGVLLWVVAQADSKFLPEEEAKIKEVLQHYGNINDNEMSVVLASIQQATQQRIDLYTFTREITQDLPYGVKQSIVEQLFRVACVDGDLAHEEHEMIRKISGLCGLDHADFINAKIKVKKEFGMDTAGL